MPIKVYVWTPEGGNVGHASMELSDGTYISWWPEYGGKAQQTAMKAPGFQNRTLEDDVRDEGKNPDYTFIIPAKLGLDEGSIKRWWASMKSTEKWSLLNNCCGAVKRAFEAGGAKVTINWIETPTKMIEYMKDWQERNWEPPQGKK